MEKVAGEKSLAGVILASLKANRHAVYGTLPAFWLS
jgi:hypothetical protein